MSTERCIANFLLSMSVKEFLKSLKIWQSYWLTAQSLVTSFLGTPCINVFYNNVVLNKALNVHTLMVFLNENKWEIINVIILPRDVTNSPVLPWQVVRPSVRLSIILSVLCTYLLHVCWYGSVMLARSNREITSHERDDEAYALTKRKVLSWR